MLKIKISIEDNKIILRSNQGIALISFEIDQDSLEKIGSAMSDFPSDELDPIREEIDALNDQLLKIHNRADKEGDDLDGLKEQLEALKRSTL